MYVYRVILTLKESPSVVDKFVYFGWLALVCHREEFRSPRLDWFSSTVEWLSLYLIIWYDIVFISCDLLTTLVIFSSILRHINQTVCAKNFTILFSFPSVLKEFKVEKPLRIEFEAWKMITIEILPKHCKWTKKGKRHLQTKINLSQKELPAGRSQVEK